MHEDPGSSRTRFRVLLVDDDPDSPIIIRDVLDNARRGEYEVDWCADPQAATTRLENTHYDVCLMDFYFGGQDGIESLKSLRNRGMNTPVIMFSGQKDVEVEWRAAKFGADDYLDKDDLSPALLERMIFYAIERRRVQAELVRMAKSDPLTGAANRIALYEYLDQALLRAKRHGREIAVLMIDINDFKPLNDQFGHAFGDVVLTNIVQLLKQSMRESDLLARIGGDEFVIVLDDIDGATAAERASQKFRELLLAGFAIEERHVSVEAAIGVALWPQNGVSADELLAKADAAMYAHKRAQQRVTA